MLMKKRKSKITNKFKFNIKRIKETINGKKK